MLGSPETYLLWVGVACYALLSGMLLSPLRHKYSFNGILVVLAIAVACFALSIAMRWVRLDQGPFFTLYEILLSNLFSLGLVYTLIVSFSPGTRAGSPVVLPILLLLGIWCIVESPEAVPLPASYANNWLWAHVGLGKVFLGCCLAATGMAVVRLLQYAGRLSLETTAASGELLIWKLMSAAFFFDSLMLITGAVWANDAWGRYWSWDPLETWAFLTWLALAILLHARFTFKSMPQALGWAGVVVVFSLAFLTFFGVPFFSMAPHKGIL